MLRQAFVILKWFSKLGAKFFHVVPIGTFTVVVMSLVSQVSLLIAFLLPIKIVMLLGSDGVPRFFPKSFLSIDRDVLILTLSAVAVFFYLLQAITTNIGTRTADQGANNLISHGEKIVLFEKQDELGATAYRKHAQALAGMIFASLAFTVLWLIYKDAFATLMLYLLFSTALFSLLWQYRPQFQLTVTENLVKITGITFDIGFLLVFAYVVADFLVFTPPSFIVGLITIILTRQALMRLAAAIKNIATLNKHKDKINALFFQSHAFHHESTKGKQSAWTLIESDELAKLLRDIIKDSLDVESNHFDWTWRQTTLNGVIFLALHLPELKTDLLIKLYDRKKTALALHETTLLYDSPPGLPAAKLIKSYVVEGHHVHVFNLTGSKPAGEEVAREIENRFRLQLLTTIPSSELIERYRISKPFIWDRLEQGMFERLKLIADEAEIALIEDCYQSLPIIIKKLRALPLAISVPLKKELLYSNSNNAYLLLDWGKWRIEPAGADWQYKPKEIDMISGLEPPLCAQDERFCESSITDLKLCASIFAFENCYARQQYHDAIALLHEIDALLQTENDIPRDPEKQQTELNC